MAENFIDKLFDRSVPGLNKAMDLAWKRNEALVSNIANTETPQYRAADVAFGNELEKAFNQKKDASVLMKTDNQHIDISNASRSHLVPDNTGATKADGNNVDLDMQMAKLAYNNGKYSIAAGLVRKKLRMMRMAIRYAMR